MTDRRKLAEGQEYWRDRVHHVVLEREVYDVITQVIATEEKRHPNVRRPSVSQVVGDAMRLLVRGYTSDGVELEPPKKLAAGRRPHDSRPRFGR